MQWTPSAFPSADPFASKWAFQVAQTENLPAMWETCVGKIPEKGMATHSSILAWRILWTEEPGGL